MDAPDCMKAAASSLSDAERWLAQRIGADRIMDAAGSAVLWSLRGWCKAHDVPDGSSDFDMVANLIRTAPALHQRSRISLDRLVLLRRYYDNWPCEDGEPRPQGFTLDDWVIGMEQMLRDARMFVDEIRSELDR
jgi:hypothetical protein